MIVMDAVPANLLFCFSNLNHQNLVALVGIVLDDGPDVAMIIEYMANGNLVEYLRSRGRHQIDKEQLLGFALYVNSNVFI